MSKRIDKHSRMGFKWRNGQHRFEHWYVDNQIYFITARVRDRLPAFASEEAKAVFWDRFNHYTAGFGFTTWVTSLPDNHYHMVGHLREGAALKTMMQRLHGSVAKLVNDLLPQRIPRFWCDTKGKEYLDGCLRDERQGRLTHRYVLTQCRRHGICEHPQNYPHTRVHLDVEKCIQQATEANSFLEGVPYPRYFKHRS
jgi:hypothetical protein